MRLSYKLKVNKPINKYNSKVYIINILKENNRYNFHNVDNDAY